MTELAEVALKFARECLGWDDATLSPTGAECVFSQRVSITKRLMFADLNSVMEAIRGWHRKHKLFLSVQSYPEHDVFEVQVFDAKVTVDYEYQNLCHALLAACVEASRKLKTVHQDRHTRTER